MAVEAQLVLQRLLTYIDPVTKDGQKIRDRSNSIAIVSSTNATPIVVTTATHSLKTGHKVFIFGHVTNTNANNTLANPAWTVTVISSTTFSLDGSVGIGVGGATGSVVPAHVGSVGGDKFPRVEDHLSIYNRARWALIGFVIAVYRKYGTNGPQPDHLVPGWIVRNGAFQFASGSATKPTGYVHPVKLLSSGGTRIPVLTPSEYEKGRNLLSATIPAVEDRGTTLVGDVAHVPNASDYVLVYFGLTDFLIGDILQLSGYTQTTEALDESRHETLYRGAIAMARGAGAEELNLIFAKELGVTL